MRLSTIETDPGYSAWRALKDKGRDVRVLLDGQDLKHVVTVDTDEGTAIVHSLDDSGHLRVEGDEVVTETRRGTVEVRIEARPSEGVDGAPGAEGNQG